MKDSLFIYGTLLIPEIRIALLGRHLEFEKVSLPNYTRFSVLNNIIETEYPVLKPSEGSILDGLLVFPITNADFKILNYFEGEEYFLKNIEVMLKGEFISTKTYYPINVDKTKYGHEWSIDVFKEHHLKTYLEEIIPQMKFDFKTDMFGKV